MNTASDIYSMLFENDRVRVMRAVFKPGQTAKMHQHPDHVVVVLRGGRLKMTSQGKTSELNLDSGSAVFLDAQEHEATNISDSGIEIIVTELKK
jgi:quercetin dioxygenase-like cupin family protein